MAVHVILTRFFVYFYRGDSRVGDGRRAQKFRRAQLSAENDTRTRNASTVRRLASQGRGTRSSSDCSSGVDDRRNSEVLRTIARKGGEVGGDDQLARGAGRQWATLTINWLFFPKKIRPRWDMDARGLAVETKIPKLVGGDRNVGEST